MLINKFILFENISISNIEKGEFSFDNLDEGVISSIANFFSKSLGGAVSKIDKILNDYEDAELDYWKDWIDARGKLAKVDILLKDARTTIERAKYEEQKKRVDKLITQVESKKADVIDSLEKQANGIIKDSNRLKEYWDMKKAKIDEEVARASYKKVKNSTEDEEIGHLFDTEITRAAKKAREKENQFKASYPGQSFDHMPAQHGLTIYGSEISIEDLINKPLSELQGKLSKLSIDKLDEILKFLEKEIKKIKDQKDNDIRLAKNNKDINQINDIERKTKTFLAGLQSKIDYIDRLKLASSTSNVKIRQAVKNDPNIVTDLTVDELGQRGIDNAIRMAIDQSKDLVEIPDVESVTEVITDQVKKNFASAKKTIEAGLGEEITDNGYKHIQNDMVDLYGKLVIYYNKLKKGVPFKILQFGLIDFASELYKYKQKKGILDRDLSKKELDEQFEKYSK